MQHIVIAPPGAAVAYAAAFIVPDTREAIELAVEALIGRLDEMDGDSDLEAAGDELDGTGGEDDFIDFPPILNAPGCPVSDSDRFAAGHDGVFAGAASLGPYSYRNAQRFAHHEIGSDEDAEECGDVELNGDEGDYSR